MQCLTSLVLLSLAHLAACDDLQTEATSGQGGNVDVVKTFTGALMYELQQFPYPPVVAVIALGFGLVLLFDGKRSFNASVTFAFAAVFGTVARATALSHWLESQTDANSSQNVAANFVGIEVAILVGAIAHFGHKGVLVVLGAAAGFFLAHLVGDFLIINLHCKALTHVEVQIAWYSVWCLVASIAIFKDKHVGILALLSPIPGGIFVASSVLYFATEGFIAFGCTHNNVKNMWSDDDAVCPHNLTPRTGQWIQFFMLGFSKLHSVTGREDVGIFFNSTFNMKHGSWSQGNQQVQGYAILYDHLLTMGLWIVLSLVGIKVQRRMLRKTGTKIDKTSGETRLADENNGVSEKTYIDASGKTKDAVGKKEADKNGIEDSKSQPAKTASKWPFSKKEIKAATLEEGLLKGAGA